MHTTQASTSRSRILRLSVMLASVVLLFVALAALPAAAQSTNFGLDEFANQTNLGTEIPLVETIARIVNIALGFLGVLAVIIVLYGGYLWMTARGDAKQIDKAKKVLAGGVIGLAIILASFAIASFVINQLRSATHGGPPGVITCPDGSLPPCPPPGFGDSYLKLRSSAPRGSNVSLCAAVQAGFSDVVQVASVGSGTFSVVNTDTGVPFTSGTYQPTSDSTNFAFVHPGADYAPNANYRVTLSGGAGGIASVSGDHLRADTSWQFRTGTLEDDTAPTVVAVEPPNGASDICRATPVQIAFSEPMLATSFAGNVVMRERANPANVVALSEPSFGDAYRIATFYPLSQLNADTEYEVLVQGGPTGVADVCGNTMASDYAWGFRTGQTIECRPVITSINPAQGDYGQSITLSGASLFLDGEVEFNRLPSDTYSFDGQPNILCWNGNNRGAACASGQIIVRVPVGASTGPAYDQDGAPAATGPVRVVVGRQASNDLQFSVTSPVVERVSPSRGGEGQFVTLTGWNFGDAPGEVRFIQGATQITAPPPTACSNTWGETEALVMVPSGLAPGSYDVELRTAAGGTNGGAKRSNSQTFQVTSDAAGPGICEVVPASADLSTLPVGVSVTGERFDGNPRSLNFGSFSASNVNWISSQQVDAQTPADAGGANLLGLGRWPVCVTVSGQQSNCRTFAVTGTSGGPGGDTAPRVVESRACTDGVQSPSPWRDSTDACGNARIAARFTVPMDQSTLTVGPSQNVFVEQCGNASAIGACTLTLSSGTPQYLYNSQNQVIGFAALPSAPMQVGYWYRGTITTGVTSQAGVAMQQTYQWTWRVASALCPLQNLRVDPAYATVRNLLDTQTFTGDLTAGNCNSLDPTAYTWQWGVANHASDTGPQRASLLSSNENVATVEALDWTPDGQPARVTGGVPSESRSDTSDLYISTTFCREFLDCNACGTGISRCVAGACEPVITNMSPADGAVGTWVTLQGCYFGNQPGTVRYQGVPGLWPDPAICGTDVWSDRQIISEVPGGIPTNDSQVIVSRPDPPGGSATSPQNFTVNSVMRPALCRVVPSFVYQSQLGTATVDLMGQNLGSSSAGNEVRFLSEDGLSTQGASTYNQWTMNQVTPVVPVMPATFPFTGTERVRVYVGATPSNDMSLDLRPGSPPGDTDGPINLTGQSPAPGSNQICRNVVVTATFDGPVGNLLRAQDFRLYRVNASECDSSLREQQAKRGFWRWLADLFLPGAKAQLTTRCLVATSYRQSGNTASLMPQVPLMADSVYRVELRSPNVLFNGNACNSSGNYCDWAFMTGPDICQVARVQITPPYRTFTQAGDSVTFTAAAQAADGQALAATYAWTEADADDVIQVTSALNQPSVSVEANNQDGNAVMNVTAIGSGANSGQAQASASVTVYLCDVPWELNDAQYDFTLRYCRGDAAGPLLPELNIVTQNRDPATSNGLLREYFMKTADGEDAVGLRIYQNPTRLSPGQWYDLRTDITRGSPQATTVDGYVGLKDSQTLYVGGVARSGANRYANIYVLSLSQNASAELSNIFGKLAADWQFNTASPVLTPHEKQQLQNDLTRLQDLSDITAYLNTYQQSRTTFPTLPSGSFIAGRSTSAWPSWQATLGNELGRALPIDPLNRFGPIWENPVSGSCPTETTWVDKDNDNVVDNAECDRHCPDGFDQATCWRASTKTFTCPAGSHIYQYRVGSDGTSFILNANLEVKNVTWVGQPNINVGSSDSCDSYGGGGSGPIVDTSPPSSVSLSIVGSPTTDRFTLSWTAAADTGGSGLSRYELLRAPDASGSPGTFSVVSGNIPANVTMITDSPSAGIFWYGVRAVDAAGNGTREQNPQRGVKDTTAPSVPSCAPGSGTYTSAQQVSCTASDQGSPQTGAFVRYATGAATPTCGSPTLSNPTTVSATTTLNVIACDEAGNSSGVAAYQYTISQVSRSASLTGSPEASGWISSPSGFTYTASCVAQSGTTLVDCRTLVSVNGGTWTAAAPSPHPFTEGACHRFQAMEIDSGGSVNSSVVPLNGTGPCLDSAAPVFTAMAPQQSPTSSPPVITWAANDAPGSGIERIEVWRSETPGVWVQAGPALPGTATSFTDTSLTAAGTYTYGLHAVDVAGNCITESGGHCGGVASDSRDTRTSVGPDQVVYQPLPAQVTISLITQDDAGANVGGVSALMDGSLVGLTPTSRIVTPGTYAVSFENPPQCYTASGTVVPAQPHNYVSNTTVTGTINRDAPGTVGSNPFPPNNATGIALGVTLQWQAATCATSGYQVYMGTSPSALTLRTTSATTAYTPAGLLNSTTYYWRVDSNNSGRVTQGQVWSFTTAASTATITFESRDQSNSSITGATVRLDGTVIGTTPASTTTTLGSHTAAFDNNIACYTFSGTISPSQPMNVSGPMTVTGIYNRNAVLAPTNPNPSSGATNVSITPTLSWAASACSSGYHIYIGTGQAAVQSATTSSPEFWGSELSGATSFQPGTLGYLVTYYWRIDALGPSGPVTGQVWSFTTGAQPSANVTFQSRDDAGNTITGAGVRLDGSAVGTTQLTYPVTLGSHTVAYDNNLSCYTFSSMSPGPSLNVAGPMTVTGTYNRTAPGLSTNPYPPNGATNMGLNVTLQWQSATCATTYNVYFGTSPSALVLRSTQSGTSYTPGGLNYSTTYYWRIDPLNNGRAATGAVWSFTTEAQPTATITFQSVNDAGQSVTGATARLDGAYVGLTTAQATNVTYGSHTASFDNTVACHTLASVSPTQPMNVAGDMTVTATFNRSLPSQTLSPTPAVNATNVPTSISVLTWSSGACTSSFDFYFGTNLAGVQNATTGSPEFRGNQVSGYYVAGVLAIQPLTTYYWRVDARNSAGVTTGAVWRFTTASIPPQVIIDSPAAGSYQDANFTVQAHDISGSYALVACYYAVYNAAGGGNYVLVSAATSRSCSGIASYMSLEVDPTPIGDCQAAGTNACRIVVWNQDTANQQGQAVRDFSIGF